MGAAEPVVERDEREEEEEEMRREQEERDGVVVVEQQQQQHNNNISIHNERDVHVSMLHRLNPTNPLRIAINPKTRSAAAAPPPHRFQPPHNVRVGSATPSPAASQFSHHSHPTPPPPPPPMHSRPSITTLNSRAYTNKISLLFFIVHMIAAIGLVCDLLNLLTDGMLS